MGLIRSAVKRKSSPSEEGLRISLAELPALGGAPRR